MRTPEEEWPRELQHPLPGIVVRLTTFLEWLERELHAVILGLSTCAYHPNGASALALVAGLSAGTEASSSCRVSMQNDALFDSP